MIRPVHTVPQWPPAMPLLLHFFVVHALIVGWARYSVPVVPVAVVLAVALFAQQREGAAPDA